ncbi:MAG: hypothetical protein J5874_00760 [Oscillospiraceae bacterium]|nr:hypothetical protein [Oscillospiraceae bacterium]MBQ7646928.1 hypothetical protein [Clostridia bacterium]
MDDNKQVMYIQGHRIEMTFAKEPNYALYGIIRDVLLGSESQICIDDDSEVKSYKEENKQEEAAS